MSIDRGEIEDSIEPIKSITFSNVTFSYSSSNDNQVVRDVSLTANNGAIVTVFGPYRSGKSTLFNLLLRYYDPQFGKISINQINLRQLKIHYLRSLQAIVPQTPVIFDTLDLMGNVMYGIDGKPPPSDFTTEIMKVCDISSDVVEWRSDRNLCQRISIARALLRTPRILLLDEPFAHLSDSQTVKITEYLSTTHNDRITILATSNPSELSRSSRQIFVMDWGRIVQKGTHSNLVEDVNGIYYKMN
jgi:ATP-binding cassette subfamily B protein